MQKKKYSSFLELEKMMPEKSNGTKGVTITYILKHNIKDFF